MIPRTGYLLSSYLLFEIFFQFAMVDSQPISRQSSIWFSNNEPQGDFIFPTDEFNAKRKTRASFIGGSVEDETYDDDPGGRYYDGVINFRPTQASKTRAYNLRPSVSRSQTIRMNFQSPSDLWKQVDQQGKDGKGGNATKDSLESESGERGTEPIPEALIQNPASDQNALGTEELLDQFFSHVKAKGKPTKFKPKEESPDDLNTNNIVTTDGTETDEESRITHMSFAGGIKRRQCPSNEVLKHGKCMSRATVE